MLPLLRYVADRERTVQNAITALADQLKLSHEERHVLLPSGRTPVFNSRVNWAGTYLVQAGLLSRPRRGVLQITERGKSVLAENPPSINNQLLSRFPEFNDFRERSRSSGKQKPGAEPIPTQILEDTPKQSPEERIDIAFQELTVALRTELLDRIRAAPPAFFEHLIVDLIVANRNHRRPGSQSSDGRAQNHCNGCEGLDPQSLRLGP